MAPDSSCTVWWAAAVDPAAAPGLVGLLDGYECDRLDRFRRPADRARYLAAHALGRVVIAQVLDRDPAGLRFDRTCRCGRQHGKPRIDGGPEFSLTHAGELVGVAVHATAVGLDVEPVRELADLEAMAERVCSPAELARDRPLGPAGFLRTWTRKEALLKATGDGLSAPMAAITLGPGGVEAWTGRHAPAGPVWIRDLCPRVGYRAAVAGLGADPSGVVERDAAALLHRD